MNYYKRFKDNLRTIGWEPFLMVLLGAGVGSGVAVIATTSPWQLLVRNYCLSVLAAYALMVVTAAVLAIWTLPKQQKSDDK